MEMLRLIAGGAADLLLSGLRNEIDQMTKLAVPSGQKKSSSESNTSAQQPAAAPLETAKPETGISAAAPDAAVDSEAAAARALQKELRRLQRENARLNQRVRRLQWEPKRARDALVQLGVALSAAFAFVVFPLFVIAERNMSAESWTDRAQGRLLLLLSCMLCFGAAPLTHMSGRLIYEHFSFRFFQPGRGGKTYVALQAVGWASYGIFIIGATAELTAAAPVPGLSTAAGVAGVLAQTFMVCSLLSYCPAEIMHRRASSASGDAAKAVAAAARPASASSDEEEDDVEEEDEEADSACEPAYGMESDFWFDANLSWNVHSAVRLDSDTLLLGAFVLLQSTLVFMSFVLGAMAELGAAQSDTHRRVLGALSLLLLIVPAVLTHTLGGMLFNKASWSFVQPFAGGTRFVALQAVTWALFGLSLLAQASFLGIPVYIFAGFSGMKLRYAGVTAVAAHMLMVLSLRHFDPAHHKSAAALATPRGASDRDENPALAEAGEQVRAAALKHGFAHVTEAAVLDKLWERMTQRYTGLRAAVGTTMLLLLCNTQWVIFVGAAAMYYLPVHVACVATLGQVCAPQPLDTLAALQLHSLAICILTILYTVLKTFGVSGPLRLVILTFISVVPMAGATLLHWHSDALPLLQGNGALWLWYVYSTYTGVPEVTGRREWTSFRGKRSLWRVFQDYHGAEVACDAQLEAFEAADGGHALGSEGSRVQKVIFGFHPHGIFPTTLIWMPNAPMFRDRWPALAARVTAMTASVIHVVPIMRDIAQWSGVRDVGRAAVDLALRQGRSPMLVVGGQSEMFESKSWPLEIAVHRGHRGFIRMAIKHGVPLVPIFSFGEHTTMDNLYLPRLQAWSKKRLGFPIPYVPYGRWGVPLSRRVPITVCVGAPVAPVAQDPRPSREVIDELHARYFAALERLFEDNKARCGFSQHSIAWTE